MADIKRKAKVIAIVAAGGKGQRLGSRLAKTFVLINKRPILFFALSSLTQHPLINEIILVTSRKTLFAAKRLVEKYRFKKVKHIVVGGRTRKASVSNGLKKIRGDKHTFVLIHDAARPFLNRSLINRVVNEAFRYNASICAVPAKCTIKSLKRSNKHLFIKNTLDRSLLCEVQTPQVFRLDLLKRAFSKGAHQDATDDAALVERLKVKVGVVNGSYSNIKITTCDDLLFARAIAKQFKYST
ncbi:MAG: 2-C-methyl-D-erythritol 4-phosphate cytidylyltransferase [Candidatus Omnitrophica bacterium]|nr:2-C-methyl-D-erythritol 4-phosphate cytidylyltransferase [Candidatus Omnitrophota bacterium]